MVEGLPEGAQPPAKRYSRLFLGVYWAGSALACLLLLELVLAGFTRASGGKRTVSMTPVYNAAGRAKEPAVVRRFRDEIWRSYVVYDPLLGIRFRPHGRAIALEPAPDGTPAIAAHYALAVDRYGFISNASIPNESLKLDVLAKDPELFRILVSGGSTTAGWGASDNEHTWPARLEKILQQRLEELAPYRAVAVINSGVFDYNMSQEIVRFVHETAYLNPHVVISFNGINDRWDYRGNTVDYSLKPYQYELVGTLNGTKPFTAPVLFPYVRTFLHRLRSVESDPNSMYGYRAAGALQGNAVELFLSKSRQFHALCTAEGIHFLHCFQPLMGTGEKRLTSEEEALKKYMGSDFYPESWDAYVERARRFYGEVRPRFNEPYQVDCAAIFDDVAERAYFDPRHYNDLGNELIAQRIAELVVNTK
ncbi:MAG: SGNH/GDSL hydrolase family protein [Candidatus Hydrogenedentes bacterium]|nr:SGNH/GDSL hydrolase family protein [Candidatus Hydrogenedentota bacterium]